LQTYANTPPEQNAGLIVLRLNSQDRKHVLETIEHIIPLFKTEKVFGALWIATEQGVRIHGQDE